MHIRPKAWREQHSWHSLNDALVAPDFLGVSKILSIFSPPKKNKITHGVNITENMFQENHPKTNLEIHNFCSLLLFFVPQYYLVGAPEH